MKRLPQLILLIVAALVTLVTGCDSTPGYDGRLTAADALMHDAPDSALAIVEAVSPDSLATEADLAYRALLLTQARYRCYVTASNDSDINRALAYYLAHSREREKFTRAYIYKGAVMEELGHPDSAMLYYKHAEANADPNDYFNLGYTKMRMGNLYDSHYSMDGKEALKYEEALECFRLAKDSVYMLICLNNLGCQYRGSKPDTAESLLKEAYRLAKMMRDTTRIVYNSWSLVEMDYSQGKYEEARQRIQEIASYGIDDFDYKLFFTASTVYAKLGIIDTAEMYFSHATKNHNEADALYKMYRLEALGELALSKKDTLSFLRFERESEKIADSLKTNSQKLEILHAETSYDKESIRQSQSFYNRKVSSYQWLVIFVVVVMAIMAILALRYYRRVHRYDKLISELKKENESQLIDLKTLQQNVNELKIKDIELKDFISSHIDMMRNVIEECYHTPHSHLSKEIRQIVQYQDQKTGIWNKLYHYLDLQYNNIMSDTMKRFPQLGEKDLLMIALTCMGYSCAQIAIVLDYSNSSGISTIRKRIASKMGLDCLLGEYIEQYKSQR